MRILRTRRQDDADLARGQSSILGKAALDDSGGRFAFRECVPDRENSEAFVYGHGWRRRIEQMSLGVTGEDRVRRSARLGGRDQPDVIKVVFVRLAVVTFEMLEHSALERSQLGAIPIPNHVQRLQRIACLTGKECLQNRQFGRHNGWITKPNIPQRLDMGARPPARRQGLGHNGSRLEVAGGHHQMAQHCGNSRGGLFGGDCKALRPRDILTLSFKNLAQGHLATMRQGVEACQELRT